MSLMMRERYRYVDGAVKAEKAIYDTETNRFIDEAADGTLVDETGYTGGPIPVDAFPPDILRTSPSAIEFSIEGRSKRGSFGTMASSRPIPFTDDELADPEKEALYKKIKEAMRLEVEKAKAGIAEKEIHAEMPPHIGSDILKPPIFWEGDDKGDPTGARRIAEILRKSEKSRMEVKLPKEPSPERKPFTYRYAGVELSTEIVLAILYSASHSDPDFDKTLRYAFEHSPKFADHVHRIMLEVKGSGEVNNTVISEEPSPESELEQELSDLGLGSSDISKERRW